MTRLQFLAAFLILGCSLEIYARLTGHSLTAPAPGRAAEPRVEEPIKLEDMDDDELRELGLFRAADDRIVSLQDGEPR